MTAEVVAATVVDLVRGVLILGLAAGLVLFHRAGMARIHRGGAHVARLRPGMRDLTQEERQVLVQRQRLLEEAAEGAWLSPSHRYAREALCTYVAQLADDHVPLSQLADAMGVRKQRAHQQAQAGRELVAT